ncbi:hypothetical protein [Streptomyces drozdowiczii]|uniref:hypothetical protein n=1 Tax=Streptomyces drozdowiczii TaxID=202862 RepID=UPI00403C0C23
MAGRHVGVVERELLQQVFQGPPAGVACVVLGCDRGVGGDDGRVGDGDVPAARVAAGGVSDADLAQVVGGHQEAGLLG